MSTATVVFQALYPDPSRQEEDNTSAKIVYDIEFEGKLYSHLVASVSMLEDETNLVFEHDLPFEGSEFAQAARSYCAYVMGQHGQLISPSGPKGLLPSDNVFRVEWVVTLKIPPSPGTA